ncbi:hypothetical protein Pst134EB_030961 [Puccinia striiformis f. sp. tritici]|nr:hypothetical protein Pst134EB_030961 [Puccinia striiformis f. sp. tritici]
MDPMFSRSEGPEKKEFTEDELDQKNRLFDQVQSTLVPLIQEQVDCVLSSLELQGDLKEEQKEPNFDVTCEYLSELDETLQETIKCVESAAIDIMPIGAHDHYLKRCKEFTSNQLMHCISNIIIHVHGLFVDCSEYIKAAKLASIHPDDLKRRGWALLMKRHIPISAAGCNHSTNKAIQRFQPGSDFDFIRDEWEERVEAYSNHLESLTKLTHHRIRRRRDRTPLRKHVIELARFTIPLIKLTRILSKKISSRNTKILPFTLDTELNSETLSQLYDNTETIEDCCRLFIRRLVGSYNRNALEHDQAEMRGEIIAISQLLDSILLDLALHLIPLPVETDSSRRRRDFKTWISSFQVVWHRTTHNMLYILDKFEAENLPETAPDR